MNKNKIVIALIVAALFAPMFTQAQSNERAGPPNSVRKQRGEGGSTNRQSIRKPPSGNNNQRGSKRGERKPQTSTTRTEGGGSHNPLGEMKKALNLSDMQTDWFRAVHEKWHKAAKAIHSDKELSGEQKKAKLKEAFKKMDVVIRKLLNEEQYAGLVKIRHDRARPHRNDNNNNSNYNNDYKKTVTLKQAGTCINCEYLSVY